MAVLEWRHGDTAHAPPDPGPGPGPLVYAFEGVDHGGSIAHLALPPAPAGDWRAAWRHDLLGGVVALEHPTGATAVPYFAWANRGPDEMAVWLPLAD